MLTTKEYIYSIEWDELASEVISGITVFIIFFEKNI